MALLLLMQDWTRAYDVPLSAVTVDHGLRPAAAEEAQFVAGFCTERGIPHATLRWDGKAAGGNLQAEARAARYRVIAEWAKGQGIDAICLGHTRDDQAETFVMRLARKAGSDGLRGMADRFEREGATWMRPLLTVDRADLRAFLRHRGVAWVEDPSNEDERFDRVRARKALAVLSSLGIDAGVLEAVALNLAAENDVLRQAVVQSVEGQVSESFGALSIARDAFDALHPEVSRRFVTAAVRWIANTQYAPRSSGEAGLGAALGAGKAHTLGGVIAFVSKGRVWLAREFAAAEAARGNPFDGRWRIDGPLAGLEIRALGDAGLKQWPGWRGIGVPRRVLLSLPGVWQGDELRAIPHDPAENRFKASLVTTSFQNWLSRH